MSEIVVRRDPGQGMFRRLLIKVDDVVAGHVKNDRSTALPVSPGRHVVPVAIDWQRSPSVVVEVPAGEVVELRAAVDHRSLTWSGLVTNPGQALLLEVIKGSMDKH